jgi:DNA-binding response OmpR family regulator
MTQPDRASTTIGDLVVDDLSRQLGTALRNLAVASAQYQQLLAFVESKSDVLGLDKVPEKSNTVE